MDIMSRWVCTLKMPKTHETDYVYRKNYTVCHKKRLKSANIVIFFQTESVWWKILKCVMYLLTFHYYFFQLDSKIKAQIHPSSVMFKTKPELVIFTELICTQKNYLRTLSLVDATWLIEAQPQYFRQHRIIQSGE